MSRRPAIFQLAPANNRKSERENALTFPTRSGKGGEVGAAFGVRWAEEMREVRHQLCGPQPTFNGESIWTFP